MNVKKKKMNKVQMSHRQIMS